MLRKNKMKRIVSIILVLLMTLSLVSCSSSLIAPDTAHKKTQEEEKTEEKTVETEAEKGPVVLPEGFSVGYAKRAANPQAGVGMGGYSSVDSRLSEVNLDDIMVTCTALSDGENVFLLFCSDTLYVGEDIVDAATKRLEKRYEGITIPAENIFFNATHTHSAPAVHLENAPGIGRYMKVYYPALYAAADGAMHSLSPATAEYSSVNTENLNYVRRYVSLDGKTYIGGSGLPGNQDPALVRHETQPDTQMQLLRFRRQEGKDVVLCNWQCHPCSSKIGAEKSIYISADWCGQMRKHVEQNLGVEFAYLQGAGGNLVSSTKIRGEKTNSDYLQKGKELAEVVEGALENTRLLHTGAFRAHRESVPYPRNAKNPSGDDTMYLSVLTIGDVAIATVPCEFHDTLGVQVKSESPFPITLMCAYTSGSHGYIPASFAFEMGGYEVESTRYERGTGEKMVEDLLTMLREIQ